jgi:hypothetical protein
MKTHILCFVAGLGLAILVNSFRQPEIRTVEVERIRTVAMPPPISTPTIKAKDPKFADVRISPKVMKMMMIGSYINGKIGHSAKDFLQLTEEEIAECQKAIDEKIEVLKILEQEHMRVVESEEGETLIIDSYWEQAGMAEYESLKTELKTILGDSRGEIMAIGVGQSTTEVGNFGYYQTRLHIEDRDDDNDGKYAPALHLSQEAPFAGMRKLIESEQDPATRQRLTDDYTIKKARAAATSAADAPFLQMGSIVPATDPNEISRWKHVFDKLAARSKNPR